MTKHKLYRYIGYNGIITSPVLLPDINHLELYELRADGGKHLTNGNKKVSSIIVEKDQVSNWVEIDNDGQN